MAFRFFSIPMQGCVNTEAALNAFLRSHQIASVERRFIDQGLSSVWSLCIDYADPESAAAFSAARPGSQRGKVDYREILSPPQFAVFSRLRDARKQFAQSTGAPVYTIFTNEQLAQMVQQQAGTKSDLEKILGVGDARIEKYGERILQVLSASTDSENEAR
jgi:superfamily II DNA helicase RecQ